jgi:hypothetical protein
MIFFEGPRVISPFRLGSGWPGPAPSPGFFAFWALPECDPGVLVA